MIKIAKEIRFIDLFGGIGGFRLGLQRSGSPQSECWRSQSHILSGRKIPSVEEPSNNDTKFKCVWYCDIDKYAVQTYNKNFNENWSPTDIKQVKTESIPDFDLLCAGFPCQAFSIAGKRKGFEDTRGTLFFEIARIIRDKRPRLLFLENVKGLLNHDEGRTFRTIFKTLDELGYCLEWEVLNSKNFGVPQNRERVFIIGHLGGFSRGTVFPLGRSCESTTEIQGLEVGSITSRRGEAKADGDYIIEGDREALRMIQTIKPVQLVNKNRAQKPYNPNNREMKFKVSDNNVSYTVKSATHEFMILSTNTKIGYDIAKEKEDGIRLQFEKSKTARGRVVKGNSQSLQTSGQIGVLQKSRIRRLTPIECERLQGFPDGWTSGVSDTQRYKQLGNSVTVNVIEEIGKKILKSEMVNEK